MDQIGATRLGLLGLATALAFGVSTTMAASETSEIRIAQLYGLSYLPSHVVIDQKLIQKHVEAAGLPPIEVTLAQVSSGAAANDYLLSGNADFAMGGATVLMTLWDRTKGNANVKAAVSMTDTPMYLITVDPEIQKLEDYGDDDRIAVTAVKVTMQAIFLQMAAAKNFGWEERFRFDPLTVSMSHPDSVAALLSGELEVKSHVATVPFNFQNLRNPAAREILNSFQLLDGPHTSTLLWTTEAWKTENPKTYAAVVAAFEEAIDFIHENVDEAAETFLRAEKSAFSADEIKAMLLSKDDISFSYVPSRTHEFADFMHKVGLLNNQPESWKDYFFENNHDKPGS